MKQLKFVCLILYFFCAISLQAQKVSNVSNRQEQSTIIVSYDLETKKPCKIALYVSTNGGTTWQGPLKKVSGDIGANISSGNKSITWNVLEEFEELKGTNIMFQIRAVDTSFETVIIGNQEWTKKNLDVSTYSDGTPIPEVTDPTQWDKLTTGAWCYYNNDPKNGPVYGKLYNWYAVAGIYDADNPALRKKLVPTGWHIPSDSEWTELIDFLGGESVAGDKMKSTGTSLWISPETYATNESGFTGLPGGARIYNAIFNNIGYSGSWWSPTEKVTSYACYRNLSKTRSSVYKANYDVRSGFSVRCIRD
jgi:uncharacterized protein (TIGR02145 family)